MSNQGANDSYKTDEVKYHWSPFQPVTGKIYYLYHLLLLLSLEFFKIQKVKGLHNWLADLIWPFNSHEWPRQNFSL